jgi:hypothetical protein
MQHHPAIDPGTIGVFRVVLTRLGPLEIWGPLHLVAILLALVAIVLCILDLPLGPPKGWQWGIKPQQKWPANDRDHGD